MVGGASEGTRGLIGRAGVPRYFPYAYEEKFLNRVWVLLFAIRMSGKCKASARERRLLQGRVYSSLF